MNLTNTLAVTISLALATGACAAADLVIATVNNGHMIEMQKLAPQFEKAYPDIKLSRRSASRSASRLARRCRASRRWTRR
jgi:hypothetical protein